MGPIVHAGSDLLCDGTEPTHHRTLIRPDDIEARGQVRREQGRESDAESSSGRGV